MTLYLLYDDGAQAGLGHYRRAHALAQKLTHIATRHDLAQHIQCVFVPIMTHNLTHIENLKHFCAHIQPEETLGVVVDSYAFGVEHFSLIDSVRVPMVCFDDTNRAVYPPHSFILNGAPNAHKLYPTHTSQHLLGLGFGLCDEAFAPITSVRESVCDIFVSFGGSDVHNLSAQTLPHIPESYTIHLVLGKHYPHTPPHRDNLILYQDLSPTHMHEVMRQCDIAISAGGGTLIELAKSLMPTIMIESAPNQHFQIEQFATLGVFLHAHMLLEIPELLHTLEPRHIRESYKARLSHLDIGGGISRLCAILGFNKKDSIISSKKDML